MLNTSLLKKLRFLESSLLVAAVLALSVTAQASEKGKAIFQEKCVSCHSTAPAQKVSIQERNKIGGSPLWFAGSRLQAAWLEKWLAAPTPLLSVTWNTVSKGANDHIALDGADAAEVTAYLTTLVDATVASGKATPMPKHRGKKRGFVAKTRALFEKHQGCFACHKYLNKRNQELGGFTAPSLVDASKRLNGDWVYAFMKDPQRYFPNLKCPIPGDKAVNQFTDKQMADLATYIVNIGVK